MTWHRRERLARWRFAGRRLPPHLFAATVRAALSLAQGHAPPEAVLSPKAVQMVQWFLASADPRGRSQRAGFDGGEWVHVPWHFG
jgi:hypothetical protein